MNADSGSALNENAWKTLVSSVVKGRCTPFLGAGVATPHLPSGGQLAVTLAAENDYPFSDPWNLTRVSQYLATMYDPPYARDAVGERLFALQQRYLDENGGAVPVNYARLASLRLPVYVTTNYDVFMESALRDGTRTPSVQVARWNERLLAQLGEFPDHEPTSEEPMLFHMHGKLEASAGGAQFDSLLLSDDDYIDFTVALAMNGELKVLPHQVREVLSWTNLLFVGYSLEDWNFRVLMRLLFRQQKIVQSDTAMKLSIQLEDRDMAPEKRVLASEFLKNYMTKSSSITVHWCDAGEFLAELQERVEQARS